MSKKIPLGAAIAAVLAAVILTVQITTLALDNRYARQYAQQLSSDGHTLSAKLQSVDSLFRQHYMGEWDEDAMQQEVIDAYIQATGDRYGDYYTAEEFSALNEDLMGQMVGIGIMISPTEDSGAIQIVATMPDSPAEEAGIQPGDLIVAVEGQSVSERGYTESTDAMIGEEGTTARFTLAKGGDLTKTEEMAVERRQVTALSVLYHMADLDGLPIGVIKIMEFDATTPMQVTEALANLTMQFAQGFIFDVRWNPGGELQSVLDVLDTLVPEGVLLRVTDAAGNESTYGSDADEIDKPMAVLVNGGTASAAELFASVLRDYDKAFLVGEQTYGKGSMQTILRLEDNSAIKVTYRKYSPPFSDNYDGIGLTPDVEVALSEEAAHKNIFTIADSDDNQLVEALRRLAQTITDKK